MSKIDKNAIVISGMSGLFPNAKNVQELCENLYNQIDMVSKLKKHPNIKHPELPQFYGTAKNMEKFDPQFFRTTSNQAKCVDPMVMKILEQTLCALFDAGINPETLKASKTGVFIANSQSDAIIHCFEDIKGVPLNLTGHSKSMLANRISYWLDLKGPSYCIDSGCAGSLYALERAYHSIKNNEIDSAIVGACNFVVHPQLTINMKRAGLLCMDGKTKCFDKNGNGFVRSDAVAVLYMQKANDAKRIYSEVCHVKGNYFTAPDGSFSLKRDPKDIERFLEEFYTDIDVTPTDVDYIEANSFGIAESDENELEAIGNVFAKNKVVNIGSIKSNMGNAECASGVCSITKLCLAYQKGEIAGSLHFEKLQSHIAAANEKQIHVVTENEPFSRKYSAINNFCYTGSNSHALFKGHYIPKDKERYKSYIPRLVLVSSRDEAAVNNILDTLESSAIHPEQLALLNDIYKVNIPGYTGRGYTVLDTNKEQETVCLSRGFEYFTRTSRPVWFLYSGMGSQWPGMGEGLLKIPVFAAAIERCHNVLKNKGLDLKDIITNKNQGSLNILSSLVAINAIQIGLTDLLKSIGIVPDKIIGHSLGEIACAYADGAFTTEEAILAAYYRALASQETKFIKASMAAVGLGYNEVKLHCPPEIEIACHNSFESSTLSGPSEIVKAFVKKIQERGIFAKEVASYNIAFHSRYIAEAGPKMLKDLKELITEPKLRSNKWLSTCYLPEDWHKPESQYASAEYFTHNLLGSVLFEEAARLIPKDALIIEIAPHGLLQAIMKRSHSECVNISLTRRGEKNSPTFLLKAIGSLYQNGLNPDLATLYPKVEFPVSTETPTLSNLVEWDHRSNWLFDYNAYLAKGKHIWNEYILSLYDDDFAFLKYHTRNDMHVISEATLLVFVWDTFAVYKKKEFKNMSVNFENITFYQYISFEKEKTLKVEVTIQKGSKKFEILHKNTLIVDGYVKLIEKPVKIPDQSFYENDEKYLTQNEIYTILESRGITYEKDFQCIESMNTTKTKAIVKWYNNWTTYLDSIIQVKALSTKHDGVSWVKFINNLTIDVDCHEYSSIVMNDNTFYNVFISEATGKTQCGGVLIKDIIFNTVPKTKIEVEISKHLTINIGNLHSEYISKDLKNNLPEIKLTVEDQNMNNFENLTWTETPVITKKSAIQVCYSGLSTKDYKNLCSSQKQSFGMDFSGYDRNGNKVMGIVPHGAIASTLEADIDLLWPVPQHWSLAEAATVPLPYVHALYCLAIRNILLEKSTTILVIGGAGALGQAVISIALYMKCRIFATVRNAEKKKFLLRLFPELDENNIGFTYDTSFSDMVIERTQNKRCHVVVNTASGNIREAAIKCIGETYHRVFLDVNDSDQKDNKALVMSTICYKSVRLATIFEDKYSKYKKVLQHMLSDGIAKGYVRPLSSVIYMPCEVSRAFRLLSNRSNMGRVLMRKYDTNESKQDLNVVPRLDLNPNKTYIVVYDECMLGAELINLMIQRGAKRFIINTNPQINNEYFHIRYASWKNQGAIFEFNSDDLCRRDGSQKLLDNTLKIYKDIDGIFIACTVYSNNDAAFDKYMKNISLMISHLDDTSRKCTNLRYFAVIVATNSAMLNVKFLERCCLLRNKLGLASLLLCHIFKNKVWLPKSLSILMNGLEYSLKNKLVSVSTYSDEKDDQKSIQKYTNFDAGLFAFYQNVTNDELDATEPVVQMKTKARGTYENELMVDPEATHIIMIPGFESNANTLTSIAELMKKPAIALQMDLDCDSISNIALKLWNNLKRRFILKSPFYLVGYSFGVNVAFELAALLEKDGVVGVVFCVDSSPDALRAHLDAYLGDITQPELQNSLIEHIFTLLVGHRSEQLKAKLKTTTAWPEKVELFINIAKTYELHSLEYMKHFIETAYSRIMIAKNYEPNFVLESQLVLLKGIPHPNADLTDDYNLSKYSKKPLEVIEINSDFATALCNYEIPNFINRFFIRTHPKI